MRTTRGALLGLAALVCGTLSLAGPAHAITINALFSSGCSTNCYGLSKSKMATLTPDQQAAIDAADDQIASQFGGSSMSTDIVYVGYHGGTNSFLGASVSGATVYTYAQYVAALALDSALHPHNTVLSTAVANLASGNGFGDPTALVNVNTTTARNLGLTLGVPTTFGPSDQTPEFDANGNFVGPDFGGVADGVIFLNVDQPLSFTRPFSTPGTYDAESTMEHETDEVLGIGGAGSVLNTANGDPTNYALDDYGVVGNLYGVLDLYRYTAPGTPSFDPSDAFSTDCPAQFCDKPSPYFSVDGGVTSIDTFNQMFPVIGGDAGDWGINWDTACPFGGFGGTGDVQDAFSCSNQSSDVAIGTPAFDALEAIGFSAPEPATWGLMLIGVGLVGAALRSPRRRLAGA